MAIVLAGVVDRTVLVLLLSARIAAEDYFLMFITRLLAVGLTLVLLAIRLIWVIGLTLICHDYRLVVRAPDNRGFQFKKGMTERLGKPELQYEERGENGFGQCSARPFPTQLGDTRWNGRCRSLMIIGCGVVKDARPPMIGVS